MTSTASAKQWRDSEHSRANAGVRTARTTARSSAISTSVEVAPMEAAYWIALRPMCLDARVRSGAIPRTVRSASAKHVLHQRQFMGDLFWSNALAFENRAQRVTQAKRNRAIHIRCI